MFLVDKYFNDSNQHFWHHSIIEKILDSFDSYSYIYSHLDILSLGKIYGSIKYGIKKVKIKSKSAIPFPIELKKGGSSKIRCLRKFSIFIYTDTYKICFI